MGRMEDHTTGETHKSFLLLRVVEAERKDVIHRM
jgi:hypothetical protein